MDVCTDPDTAWRFRSVRFVGRAILLGLLVVFLRDPLRAVRPDPVGAAIVAGGIVVVLGSLWLNARVSPLRAGQALALVLPLMSASLALAGGRGFRDPAVLMMPGSLILCGILLDRASLLATTGITVAATVVVLVAEARGLLAGPGPGDTVVGDAIDSLVILGVTAVGVGIVAGRLRSGLERLQRQEAALRASELRYRVLVDLAADAILVVSPTLGITEANRRATELTGYARDELLGQPVEALFSPAEIARTPFDHEAMARGESLVAERLLTRRDGALRLLEVSSKRMPDGTHQSILRDVSERRRAEEERRALEAQLRQAQKMEAVGRLAGGVAHDFNNLLTAITGSLTLAMKSLPARSPARQWLAAVDRSSWRAATLTKRLLAFSRQQVIEPRVVDLRTIVEGAVSLVARTIGEDVRLQVRLPDEPCPVVVDHAQLEQVILNLASNARDAMPDGGVLALEVGWADVAPGLRSAEAGRRVVVLSVTDTGHGMGEDVRSRIFEPFFTTKPTGSGTGLGLAMVYGAVEQNGGWIDVESSRLRGSTFRIFLPEAQTHASSSAYPGVEEVARGTETILLVEDEAAVREVATGQLESLGYRVLPCASAMEALAVAGRHREPLHLLLTDVVMPGMNGCRLAARLLSGRPSLRVLYTSGYGEDVIARHGVIREGIQLLEKPYSLPELARQLRRALAP